ncbi:Fanconi anemia group E protein [Rhinoderma darwinii]|uniref:Fanconi anemia group E protein n=1 Tax=Rhinoderma darwinii TaxID=43563 RepID=UPI003F6751C2
MASSSLYDTDRVSRLFLKALGSGSHGSLEAYKILQYFPGPFPWSRIIERLCIKVPIQDVYTWKLILKPKLFQLPITFQRNLFSILNFIFPLLPSPCIQLLAEAIRLQWYFSDDWLLFLTHEFIENIRREAWVQRSQVVQRLQILCKDSNPTVDEQPKLCRYKQLWDSLRSDCRMQRERETSVENERRSTLSVCSEVLCTTSKSNNFAEELNTEEKGTTKEREEVPASIKDHISNLKQIIYLELDSETLDKEYLSKLQNICYNCNPLQLQTVFLSAGVTRISPKYLFQLCMHLDSITPDLSYAHAESLASIFFLEQVLSLSAPASRTVTAALTVFCRKYAWPACNTLIVPVLAKAVTEYVDADFLCRMISECLGYHELHLCFEPIFKIPCSEVSVRVLHVLVDKKEKLSQSEFDRMVNHLGHAAENFSKSMAFSKLLLVLMTSNMNLIQPCHIGLLTYSLQSNKTFMKKSLGNALKKVQESLK